MQVQYLLSIKLSLASFFLVLMLHTLFAVTRCHPEKSSINGASFPFRQSFIITSSTEWFKGITDTKTEIHVQRVDV